jgi:pullulanase-type alpha-1,6-glucosidase
MMRRWRFVVLSALLLVTVIPGIATADHTPNPSSVTIVGSLQGEVGCPGDWQPDCAATHLGYDGDDDLWQAVFTLPLGDFEYKAALNDAWTENYGAGGIFDGPNIALSQSAAGDVKFYYDHKTHWVTDNVNSTIATVAGDFQSEIGCPGDWQSDCLRSWMQDPDGDGVYEFATDQIPAGDHEFKVALDETWDVAHPATNVPFTSADGDIVTFTFDAATNDVSVTVETSLPASVTIAGSFQEELGCPGDWQPDCALTDLVYDASDDVWQQTFTIPAGAWEYKAALNGTWDVSHPANNILLSQGANGDVKFYYDDKTTWVTDNVNSTIATVAGNFQSAIGCPGDWQPDCLRSWMQDPDGDAVYEYVTDQIPAGNYEFKVALDETWDVAHPATNVPLTVAADGDLITITYNADTNEVTVDTGVPSIEPGDELLVEPVVRVPAQDDIFYFVMPDRFENGDPGNDAGGDLSGDPLVNGLLPTDKGYFHGGDIAGLTARLLYLDTMGVTAIWMTPQFTNRWVQGDGTIGGSSAGYHGYWQIDYSSIDPHFGTNAEMQAFVSAAHALGIDVFFDIVANHTGDVITYEEGLFTYRNKTVFPYLDASGIPFDDRDYAGTGTFPPLDKDVSFPYTPSVATGDETVKSPAWLNDPIYYHNRGNSTFSGESSLYGDFFGLDDLFTEHPDVQDGMIAIFEDMITTFGIDGFRIDTVKHVNDELWEAFGPAIDATASGAGRPDFFYFGEVFSGDPATTSRFTTELPLDAVLDFPFQGAAVNFASASGATNNLRDLYADDDYYTDADSNAYSLPTFVGNHDIGRIGYSLQSGNPGATDAELVARDELAHALMYFGRGMPVVYYGDEQGFTGDGGDKDARQDMMPSVVPSYNDDNLIGTSATTADVNFDDGHPLYLTLQDYAALVQANVALRQGAQLHRYSDGSAGIYAFSRIERTEQVEYIVALSNSETADSATFGTDSPATTFTEMYPGGGAAIVSDASGDVTVDVAGLGVRIFRADAPIPSRTSPIPVTYTGPSGGEEVLGRVEVGATLGQARYAETTFAVSIAGGAFETIGTDDNAPYRVFYDVSDLPAGTELVFKAIVDDLSGNLSSDKGSAVVGSEAPPPTGGGSDYAIIHYNRPAGDYGDNTTGDFNDFWGLHLWGDAIDPSEVTEWTSPKPFLGEDEFGRFAWIERGGAGSQVNFIIHRGDNKDTPDDRFFHADVNPEVWINQGDETIFTTQADAQGYVTIRYHRDDGDYGTPSGDFNTFWGVHLWGDAIDPSEGTGWTSPKPPSGIDDYGAFWNVLIQDSSQPVNFIIHRGDVKDPGPDESFIPADTATVWKQSGDEEIYPTRGAAENVATIHYHRDDGDYGDSSSPDFNDFWGMHVWTGALNPNPSWQEPVRWSDLDVFGPVFEVPLVADATELAYILHRGDTKDPGTDQFLILDEWGYEVWQLEGDNPSDPDTPHYVLPILGEGAAPGDITRQQAYWVSEDTIAWAAGGVPSVDYSLCHAPTGGMTLGDAGIEDGTCFELALGAPYPAGVDGFRNLAGLPTLKIGSGDLGDVPSILTGQIAVQALANGSRIDATGLQIPGALDDLYANESELGVVWDNKAPIINLWAPTAKAATLHLFEDSDPTTTFTEHPMTLDPARGIWTVDGERDWKNQYYLYEVEVFVHSTGQVETNIVTDPYSLSLSMNSTRTQIVDIDHSSLKPGRWDRTLKPPVAEPEDIVLYELHIRDFSANDDTVPAEQQGTYRAFTRGNSDGMKHLADLADAGLTHVHLLPAFDIATINENKAEWQAPDPAVLATYPPDSDQQQAAVTATEDLDGFNWGYDPLHYTTPEGSYSTNPDGTRRIKEFRQMVQSLNETGLRVVMDVVYNHTNASGQADKSVLDRIVPGYYHRLNSDGEVETSTCCANTATEFAMMEKLMVDSVVTWAREYKVDGFRFDLMGHHSLANMEAVRAALDSLTLEDDGVDGASIYLYGEGWNFGEVANDARFIQATQLNLGGSGIGSFNDRLRDAARGGGPFDGGDDLARRQGFINGLFYDYNSFNSGAAGEEATLRLNQDQIRVGLAGNLAAFEFEAADGTVKRGDQIDYNGQPTGYAEDPQENIIYVSAHDNQTLFDIGQYKHPTGVTTADRARAQNVGIDTTLLAQGVPFMHAGVDMLRSKSFDRDSFNSGDWFNRLDFTYQDNNWGVGLPVAGKNQDNWYLMQPRLADLALDPSPTDIAAAVTHTQEMLELRYSSDLFRLTTADQVGDRVGFHNTGTDQLPGLIVMSIDDTVGDDLDPDADAMWALINANDEAQVFTVDALVGEDVILHPVLASSADPIVRTASFTDATGTFSVPARTTAVFVRLEPDITPPNLTADLAPLDVQRLTGWYEVWYACKDDRGPNSATHPELNGIPVELGTEVFLISHALQDPPKWVGDKLFVWAPEFELIVTCADEAGNTTVVSVEPEFRQHNGQ